MSIAAELTRDKQLALFRKYAHIAVNMLHATLNEKEAEITEMAIARLDDGVKVFGDSGWRKIVYEIRNDISEELADAIVYCVMVIVRERHPDLFR